MCTDLLLFLRDTAYCMVRLSVNGYLYYFSCKTPTLPAVYGAPYTVEDKARDRERVREKHLKRRLKDKDKEEDAAGGAPTLGGSSSDSETGSGGDSDSSDDADNSNDHDYDGRSNSSGDMSANDSDDGSGADSSDEEDGGPMVAGAKRGRPPSKRSLEDQEDEVLAMLAARK